jgi:WD40 repeat protein
MVLSSLGLNDGAVGAAPKKPQRARRRVEAEGTVLEQAAKRSAPRRSTRSNAPLPAADQPVADQPFADQRVTDQEPVLPNFQRSAIFEYSAAEACLKAGSGRLVAFADTSSFLDAQLSRTYAAHAAHGLLAVGGHEGRAAVFGTSASQLSATSLLSWKPHAGWVSGLQFVDGEVHSRLLLSAGNDATVSLWDAGLAFAGAPRRLSCSVALHARGIFSMHAPRADALWTSSKDGCSRVSRLAPDGSVLAGRLFSGHHAKGVIRCVRARSEDAPNLAADGGNDGRICLLDARTATGAVLSIDGAHAGAVNTLEWQPSSSAPLLLSAGADPTARLWDVRAPSRTLHALFGHCSPASGSRLKGIYRPAFLGAGAFVASPGEGWTRLTLFCAHSGALVMQCELGNSGSSAAFSAAPDERAGPLVLLVRGGACLMHPLFHG